MSGLREALATTPTGLEGLSLSGRPMPVHPAPPLAPPPIPPAATAATVAVPSPHRPRHPRWQMVVGHVTWWPLNLAGLTNVLLDIKPAAGHRMLIQSYPAASRAGTDWYQNDAGIVLTETTIGQTPSTFTAPPSPSRARMAIQYSASIDEVVQAPRRSQQRSLHQRMARGRRQNQRDCHVYLGTSHTRLWRSSKDEWFGNTPGFYWSNNNAKDLAVRLETVPDPQGAPGYVPYVPPPATWLGRTSTANIAARSTSSSPSWLSAPLPGQRKHHGCKVATAEVGFPLHALGRHRQTQPARMGGSAGRR